MEQGPKNSKGLKEHGLNPDQQVEMTDKFERLMNDHEERIRFWKAFSAKYPDAAKKFEEVAIERMGRENDKPMN